MVVKQMFFGEDILRKHLHFDDSMIVTGRFEKKGRIGDMFRLNNGGTGFWVLTVIPPVYLFPLPTQRKPVSATASPLRTEMLPR